MKRTLLMLGLLSCLMLGGCFEGFKNKLSRDGGFITSKGDYIVINSSGNIILDVYKLKNKFVNNQTESDGVGFIDNNGNYVLIQGDCKVVRVSDSATWDKYKEYHYIDKFQY